MPNWCSNTATFVGSKKDIVSLNKSLKEGISFNEDFGRGWLPDYATDAERCLFDIEILDVGETFIHVRFDSKWAPPTDAVCMMADQFKCSVNLDYEEMGLMIYGSAHYNNGKLVDTWLSDEEMAMVKDVGDNTFMYNGKTYDSAYEAYNEILKAKKFTQVN